MRKVWGWIIIFLAAAPIRVLIVNPSDGRAWYISTAYIATSLLLAGIGYRMTRDSKKVEVK